MDQGIREGSERGKKNRPLCRDDCGSYRQRGLCVRSDEGTRGSLVASA